MTNKTKAHPPWEEVGRCRLVGQLAYGRSSRGWLPYVCVVYEVTESRTVRGEVEHRAYQVTGKPLYTGDLPASDPIRVLVEVLVATGEALEAEIVGRERRRALDDLARAAQEDDR